MGSIFILAWISADHYPPWTAFHSDFLSFVALIVYFLVAGSSRQATVFCFDVGRAAGFFAFLALVPLIQYHFGAIYFFGDALIASCYVFGFAAAIYAGRCSSKKDTAFLIFAGFFVLMAIISGAIALAQWLDLQFDQFSIMSMRVGRAYGNFAQPNQFATMMGLAVLMAYGLREKKIFGSFILLLLVAFISLGISLSQSRAGMLEILLMVAFLAYLKVQRILRASWLEIGFPVLILAFFVVSTPILAEILQLGNQHPATYASPGVRMIHWATAIDAIALRPSLGYGWGQTAVALSHTVNMNPPSGEFVEHSHNLILDLLLWNGIPLGGGLILAGCVWIFGVWKKSTAIKDYLVVIAVLMVCLHSLVEFPLEYAYVSIPLGFLLGLASKSEVDGAIKRIPMIGVGFCVLSMALLCLMVRDYYYAEEGFRALRFDSAKIGPPLGVRNSQLVLTQLDGFLDFSRTQAVPNMRQAELTLMKKVAERYGYPPVLFRYALAAGLNGEAMAASFALQRICQTHNESMCAETRENWVLMRAKYSQLNEVALPYRK